MGSGPSAGRGPGRLSCPFWRSSSGRCPLLPLGPEREASRRRPCFCSGLLPSPPGAAGLQLALKGGQARGRGAPGAPAPVGSEPRAPSLGGFSCLRERVCGHCSGGGGRARSGPRDPCALLRCGSRAGIRGRRGAGAGEGRGGGAITPSLSPAGSTRASCGARSTPGARPACAFSFSTSSSGLPAAAAAAPARPSARPPARASGAARPRAGWLLPGGAAAGAARPRRAEGGARRRSRGRAAEGRTQAAGPRCAGPPRRARPGAAAARGRPGDRLSGLPVAFGEKRGGRWYRAERPDR